MFSFSFTSSLFSGIRSKIAIKAGFPSFGRFTHGYVNVKLKTPFVFPLQIASIVGVYTLEKRHHVNFMIFIDKFFN